MELKNIHDRKDFLKIYEFGGNKGGVGEHDGFANNLSLQNTYLGKILNSMFRGISWLWRKSKENFVINKLIGRLTNELLRGVVLYCFANNININTGTESKEEAAKDSASTAAQDDVTKSEIIEIGNTMLQLQEANPELKKSLEEHIEQNNTEEIKKSLIATFMDLSEEDKKNYLSRLEKEYIPIFISLLPEEERQNLSYVPKEGQKALTVGKKTPELPAYNETVHDEFEIIAKNIDKEKLNNPSPDLIKDIFGVKFDIKNVANIKDISGYETIINDMQEYLKNNIDKYSNMNPTQQKKIQNIYMNYIFSKRILDKEKSKTIKNESVINEELVKAPVSDPRAGSDPTAKKLTTNVTVGQILSKRDKDKYKDNSEEFKINIADINLAEIEKKVEEKNDQSKVSDYVNPENLKTIQMTAEQMILPEKTDLFKKPEVGEKSLEKQKLNLRWNKELSKLYASFSSILDIDKVDIRKDYRADLESSIGKKVERSTRDLNSNINSNRTIDYLDNEKILKPIGNEKVKFSDLQGEYSLMSFISRDFPCIATVSEVREFTNKNKGTLSYLIKINKTYSKFTETEKVENFDKFKTTFSYTKSGNMENADIYFLFSNPSVGKPSNMLVFNYYTKENKLELFRFKPGKYDAMSEVIKDINTNKELFDNITNWKTLITVSDLRIFVENLDADWKTKFNFTEDLKRKKPKFYENMKIVAALDEFAKRFRK